MPLKLTAKEKAAQNRAERRQGRLFEDEQSETLVDKIKRLHSFQSTSMYPHDVMPVITDDEHKKHEMLNAAYKLVLKNGYNDAVTEFMQLFGYQVSYAKELIGQALDLYGAIEETDRNLQRRLQIQRRYALIKDIQSDTHLEPFEKYRLLEYNYTALEKIYGFDKADQVTAKDIIEGLRMPDIEITTDPSALDEIENA